MGAETWKGVALGQQAAWSDAFANPSEGEDVWSLCPICGGGALHRYYQVGPALTPRLETDGFVARGSLWEWCSGCRSYQHETAWVPDWWQASLAVDPARLDATPEVLEVTRRDQVGGSMVDVVWLWRKTNQSYALKGRVVSSSSDNVIVVGDLEGARDHLPARSKANVLLATARVFSDVGGLITGPGVMPATAALAWPSGLVRR